MRKMVVAAVCATVPQFIAALFPEQLGPSRRKLTAGRVTSECHQNPVSRNDICFDSAYPFNKRRGFGGSRLIGNRLSIIKKKDNFFSADFLCSLTVIYSASSLIIQPALNNLLQIGDRIQIKKNVR